ncbi:MAG: AAA family ATPase, partial [Candidatus Midichloria sp.]
MILLSKKHIYGYYKEMIELMRSILGKALKDDSALAKAVLTGITRVSQESLFSGLNNVRVYSLLNERYCQYFGFTEEEVVKLIKNTRQEADLNAIKEWYNCYQISKYTLYNPKQLNGILLEFKVAEVPEDLANKAQEALNQIKDKQYMEALSQHKVK